MLSFIEFKSNSQRIDGDFVDESAWFVQSFDEVWVARL
jgi:hypothetical protein